MRTRTLAGYIGAAGLIVAAGLSIAHDEDWRKVADRLPLVQGEIYRQGDPIQRAAAFNSLNMVLYSQFPINTFGTGANAGNDCWGYVSPSGREYAIMGLSNAYGFVEITDPVNATLVATINAPQSSWHDVKVIGTYAYGVSEAGSGIQVMDLSNIDGGVVNLVANVQTGGHSTSHNIIANEQTGDLWISGGNIGSGGIIHFNLSNPASPVVDGGWTNMYVHDAQIVTINPGDPQAGAFNGRNIAFCASGFGNGSTNTGLRIVDVTNPNNTTTLSTLFYSTPGYSHQVWLSEDRTLLYLNDELDELNGLVSTTTTRVIDVTDLTNPVQVATYTNGNTSIDHNLYTHNGLIFQSGYRSGLRVYDPSANPQSPVEIAFFDTFPGSDSPNFNGVWSNYPYFPSGTIIASDIERGLFVLGLSLSNLQLTPITTPDIISPDGGGVVSMTIQENTLVLDPATVEMVVNQGPSQQIIAGTDLGAGTWTFTLPPVSCGQPVSYFMRASSTKGDLFTLPANAPATEFPALVSSGQVTAFSDNAQTDLGWTTSGVTAQLSGGWTRNLPQGNNRGDPSTDADGSGNAFLTGWDAGNTNTDVDNGTAIITSPTLDFSSPGLITYNYWLSDVSAGALSPEDGLFVEVSTNNGATWTRVRTYAVAINSWIADSINIETEIGLSANGRIRFLAADLGTQNVVEAGMDAFAVVVNQCVPTVACPADLNGDGIVDNGDIGAFVTLFLAQDPAVDFNGDGVIDNGDIGTFVALFLAGC